MKHPSVRHRMWQSMRILRVFDRHEVASTATASVNTARVYLSALQKAGFLRQQGDKYQLVRNTGPKAPTPCYAERGKRGLYGVTDLNTGVTYELAWLDVLREQCQGRQITEVATELGYSRGAISMALHGKYPGDTKHIKAAVERTYPGNKEKANAITH